MTGWRLSCNQLLSAVKVSVSLSLFQFLQSSITRHFVLQVRISK